MLNELCEIKKSRLKEIDNFRSEIEQDMSMMASVVSRLKLANRKSDVCDTMREASILKLRFNELINDEFKEFRLTEHLEYHPLFNSYLACQIMTS